MTALSALAAATIVAPPDTAAPQHLEGAIRHACTGAWRAVEVLLAGDVLRGRLGKTRDTFVRDGVESVLGLFGALPVRPGALTELRAAREAGLLDGAIDVEAIVQTVRVEGAAAVGRGAITAIRRELAVYPALEAVLGEHEVGALLVDTARSLFRHAARDPDLARWAIGPTGIAQRDRALAAFAELVGSVASVEELDTLIALPIQLDDNVQFTVYRPTTIDPGRWHALLAFAHLADRRPGEDDQPDPLEEVRKQAEAVLGDRAAAYRTVTQDASSAVPNEGELAFVLELPGIEVNPPRRSFLWLEAVHREEFRIRASRELDGRTVRGRLTVFLGHIAIAEVALGIKVDVRPAEPQARRQPAQARAYRKIFASYSHKDIAIVNQFETYARALGDEYLRDWIHLRTGEVWNDRLRQLIEQADAFQLFWSWNSMHSKFVRQEYEHALALNRASFVRPTYWEDPMPTSPGLPPETLLRLHFQKLGGAAVAHPLAAHEEFEPTEPRKAALARAEIDTAVSRPARRADSAKKLDDDDLGSLIDPPAPPASASLPESDSYEFERQRESIPIRPAPGPSPPSPAHARTSPAPARPSPAPAPPAGAAAAPSPGAVRPPRPAESSPLPPMPPMEAPAAPEAKAVARKEKKREKKSEVVDEKAAKIHSTKPQSPPPMPAPPPMAAAPPKPEPPKLQQPPVSPFAQTMPQQAYKEDPFGAINAMAGTPERAEAARRGKGPLVAAIVAVLLVIAVVLFLALR